MFWFVKVSSVWKMRRRRMCERMNMAECRYRIVSLLCRVVV